MGGEETPHFLPEVREAEWGCRNWEVRGRKRTSPTWSQHIWIQTAEGSRAWCDCRSLGCVGVGGMGKRNLKEELRVLIPNAGRAGEAVQSRGVLLGFLSLAAGMKRIMEVGWLGRGRGARI